MEKYNFNIIFEKLDEAKCDQELLDADLSIAQEIDDDIRTLREFMVDSEERITFTKS